MTIAKVVVSGTIERPVGVAGLGQISFSMPSAVVDSVGNVVALKGVYRTMLGAGGAFSIELPVSNDPALEPALWSYDVLVQLAGNVVESGSIVVDIANVLSGQDFGETFQLGASADVSPIFVNRRGDTMLGPLTLVGPPTQALHAATKAYVDAVIMPVTSVFGRIGAVVAATNDYSVAQINGLQARLDVVSLPHIATPVPMASTARLYANADSGFTGLRMVDPTGFDIDLLHHRVLVVRNDTGSTILKGSPVHFVDIFPGGGVVPLIAPAKADSLATLPCVGLAYADIPTNTYGRVINQGVLLNVNTSGFALANRLYVSATTAGQLTNGHPAHPNYGHGVGLVMRSHATLGIIHVSLREIHGDELGSQSSTWGVGNNVGGGNRSIQFKNGSTLTLQAAPTAARTLTLPDLTGTLAVSAPPYTALTDAATVAVDAALGNRFSLTLTANGHVLGNPSNAVHGQALFFAIKQDGVGGYTMTLGAKFRDPNAYYTGVDIAANARSYLEVVYDSADDQFDVLRFTKGY